MKYSRWMTVVTFLLAGTSLALGQSTTRVGVGAAGEQGNNGSGVRPAISADGRFAAFSSSSTNFVPNDTNNGPDIFVRDLLMGTTERASVSSSGSQVQGSNLAPTISANGRFVAFHSLANNLVPVDLNSADDIYVRDRWAGVTERVSRGFAGDEPMGPSREASISADGGRIAYMSLAPNLVPGDTNGTWDVFVHHRASNTTVRVSVDDNGIQGDDVSEHPAISADGRSVAFVSRATNLVVGDTNGLADVFVHDLDLQVTRRVHVSTGGLEADFQAVWGLAPAISANGRWVAFASLARNFVVPDTNNTIDIFLHDRATGTTTRASNNLSGGAPNSLSKDCSLSADGRFVAFSSLASDLVAADTNGQEDVFVYDRVLGTTERVNLDENGVQASGWNEPAPAISADGRRVLFQSQAALVAGDTNGRPDTYLRDREPAPEARVTCAGDGSAAACPCGNSSPVGSGAGCLNSLGLAGRLESLGMPRVSADDFVLRGNGMPDSPALYFQGTAASDGGLGAPFGDGLRCAVGTVARLATRTNAAGASQYPGAGDDPVSIRGLVPAGGATRTYQVWYRNAAAFCTPSTFNLTNGLTVQWQP